MKNISIRYFASLKDEANKKSENISTDSNSPKDLYNELKLKYNFSLDINNVKVSVNECFVEIDYTLNSDDHVVFIPPVAGG